MEINLETNAERLAKGAESLKAFSGINLVHIKRQVAELLNLIGRNGLFDEYTKHDISHIDEMLELFDWLIPPSTREVMSPADWLVLVLSVYFHDLGMLVTRNEYANRDRSRFPAFVREMLFADDEGIDYRTRLSDMLDSDKERFLYQEFVRHNHAARVKNWILGNETDHLGCSHDVLKEIDALLANLGTQFRRDLAFICESHHLDDLDDISKYKLSQPYANSDDETANLQFAAIMLRTADLLHITSDRTPSITFRTISPSDPLSQIEWAKQMAVTRIRPMMGLNDEGTPDPTAPKSIIEVHAYFKSPEAFFGLTSFLSYAEEQLKKSHEWAEISQKKYAAHHKFPWVGIDERNIETEGFIRDTFQFTLDQARILDLLTGHTLYNDSRVVIRELVQNSLDAIRLQLHTKPESPAGHILIHWNNQDRVLSVMDNGTGMTQKIITKYLLSVGASRYQDPEFKKDYPNFFPISRFGIGVLSSFMIADAVEIVTCSEDEEMARHLTLRSVHGKYLIRLINKSTDNLIEDIVPHGTLFRLFIRPSVKIPDIVATSREWVIIPGCLVTVTIDDEQPLTIGQESAKIALEAQLRGRRFQLTSDDAPPPTDAGNAIVRVIEYSEPGVSLAYAVKWDSLFHEWSYLGLEDCLNSEEMIIGTCIGGIRVDDCTPGFDNQSLVALANLYGATAPRTNVARYGLEKTPERDSNLAIIYRLYLRHAEQEMAKLRERRSFSLSWAAHEAQYILNPLLDHRRQTRDNPTQPVIPSIFMKSLQDTPLIVTELSGIRAATSIINLHKKPGFWTVESSLFRSMEWLLREIPSESSFKSLAAAISEDGMDLPDEHIVCSVPGFGILHNLIFSKYEVGEIVLRQSERRVDLRWMPESNPPRWYEINRSSYDGVPWLLFKSHAPTHWRIATMDVSVDTEQVVTAIRSNGINFILPNPILTPYLENLIKRANNTKSQIEVSRLRAVIAVLSSILESNKNTIQNPEKTVRDVLHISDLRRVLVADYGGEFFNISDGDSSIFDQSEMSKLCEIISEIRWVLFDSYTWERRSDED